MSPDRLTFRVTGMTCDHCARKSKKKRNRHQGKKKVLFDQDTQA